MPAPQPADELNFGPATRDEPARPKYRREAPAGPSVTKMTVAIVLGLLITAALLAGGGYLYRLLFITMPEMHRLEVEFSLAFDEEKSAEAKLAAMPKYTPKPEPRIEGGFDAWNRWREEDEARKKPSHDAALDFELKRDMRYILRDRFWDKYGRQPRYLPQNAR